MWPEQNRTNEIQAPFQVAKFYNHSPTKRNKRCGPAEKKKLSERELTLKLTTFSSPKSQTSQSTDNVVHMSSSWFIYKAILQFGRHASYIMNGIVFHCLFFFLSCGTTLLRDPVEGCHSLHQSPSRWCKEGCSEKKISNQFIFQFGTFYK